MISLAEDECRKYILIGSGRVLEPRSVEADVSSLCACEGFSERMRMQLCQTETRYDLDRQVGGVIEQYRRKACRKSHTSITVRGLMPSYGIRRSSDVW